MESEAIAPELTAQAINSSGSSSASSSSSLLSSASVASSSNDSRIDSSMKNVTLGGYTLKAVEGGSDDGSYDGFVSGEEEFESASDRPIVGYPDKETLDSAIEEDEIDAAFVDSSEFSMPVRIRPVAKVSEEGDDDEYGLEDECLESDDCAGGEEGTEREDVGNEVVRIVTPVENLESREDKIFEPKDSDDTANSTGAVKENGDSGGREEAEDPKNISSVSENLNSGENGSVLESSQGEGMGVVETMPKDENLAEDFRNKAQEAKKVDGADVGGSNLSNQANSGINRGGSLVNSNGARYIDALLGLKSSKTDVLQGVEQTKNSEETSREESAGDMIFHNGSNSQVKVDYHQSGKTVEFPDQNLATEDDESVVDVLLEGLQGEKNNETSVLESETAGMVEENGRPTDELEADSNLTQKDPTETLTSDLGTEPGNEDSASLVESEETSSDKIDQTKTTQPDLALSDGNKPSEEVHIEGCSSEGDDTEGLIFGSSKAAEQFLEELERGSNGGSRLDANSIQDHSGQIDGQIATDSDEEGDSEEEGGGKELFDSAALAALLKAARDAGSDGGPIRITSQDGARLFSLERPAGLGSSLQSVKPTSRPNLRNLFTPLNPPPGNSPDNSLSETEKKKLENLQQIRVKFLRLVRRLGVSTEDPLSAQVLYRMGLVAGRSTGELFGVDAAKAMAMDLEADGREDFNFSLNILVLGKSGVGKSATINSIYGEEKTKIDPFGPATTSTREIIGVVDGVKIRVFDTPGLKSSGREQSENRKILSTIQKITKKCPPDIVLYIDRLDSQTRDLNDLPLLRSISSTLGPSIWRGAIISLTHAASAPPDGPSGSPLSYEVFVAQRSHILQQAIGQASGDLRILNPTAMNPVSLVENHPSCRKNRDGQKVLPNGQTWRPQLLLLCYSIKILAEVSDLSKPQESFDQKKLFGFRARSPPLPYLLSGLLQSRTHPKLASDQGGENGDSDTELADLSDSDEEEEEDEYDQLPPFKPLKKAQIAKLSNEQRKAYFDEYDYRVKLLQKKQLREELKRMKEIKKRGKAVADDYGFTGEDDQENVTPAAVQVPLPDMVLPPSFDGDNPAFRYRFLEPSSQFLARPVLDTHGWDHDCGYDGVNLEHSLAIINHFPGSIAAQITKDKKEFNIHLDSSVAAKLGDNLSTMAGFDVQNVGRQLAYILRGETKFKNFKKNKTAAGISVTFLGETICTGLKIEDQIAVGKRLVLVGSTGTVRSKSDSAFGANVEVRLREADYPIGQDQSTLGLSLVKWRGDMALGANLQSQFALGRSYKMAVRAGLNNKMSGQISVRTSSSDQFQIALLAILPIAKTIYKNFWPGSGTGSAGSYSSY